MPSITFALIAFNQSKYIRQAIEAVLAQDYPIDQVIISDDCSTDATYQIMHEYKESFAGSINLLVRKNKENLGIIKHLAKVVEISTGDLIIFAAGDDISMPFRTRTVVDYYIKYKPLLIHSDVRCISPDDEEFSSPFGVSISPLLWDDSARLCDVAESMILYIGATLAASRDLFRYFGPIEFSDAYEDLVLGYRAKLLGKTKLIPLPLVTYRVGNGISWGDKNIEKVHYAVLRQRIRDTLKMTKTEPAYKAIICRLRRLLYHKTRATLSSSAVFDLNRVVLPPELSWSQRSFLVLYRLARSIKAACRSFLHKLLPFRVVH